MKTACSVADQHICLAGLRRCNGIVNDSCRVRTLLLGNDLYAGAVCPLRELLDRCRTEGIGCRKDDLLALIL